MQLNPTRVSRREFLHHAASASTAVLASVGFDAVAQSATPAAADATSANSGAMAPARYSVESIGSYTAERMNEVLTTELKKFSTFKIAYPAARHGVRLYRVRYPSVIPEMNNRPTTASGLIAVPDTAGGTLPVVSYQHGSVFGKTEVPSFPDQSTETRLMLAVFASQGYVVLAADYFGKGLSPERNAYIVKASTQQACLDLTRVARSAAPDLGFGVGPLFLSGWSQGGWSTLVFLNRLENVGIAVQAAAVASGPPDLFAMMNRWANAPAKIDASYIPPLTALMLHAFEEYYGLPGFTTSAIEPQYQSAARELYLNRATFEKLESSFPARLPDMLQQSFKTDLAAGRGRYAELLQESHGYRWRAVTPMRVYYGGSDEVTPAYLAQLPVGYQQIMGGATVTAVDAGAAADHRGVFLYSLADQKKWFDSLL